MHVIEKTKKYAKLKNTTLSQLVESYLESLDNNEDIRITPLVESLRGVIDLPSDFDYKAAKAKAFKSKYLN